MLNKQNISNTNVEISSCANDLQEKQVTECQKTDEIKERLKIIFDNNLDSFKENSFYFRVLMQKFAKGVNKDRFEFVYIENTYNNILVSLCERYGVEPPLTQEEWLSCMGYISSKGLKDDGLYTVIKCRNVYDVDCMVVTKSLSEAEHVFNKEMKRLKSNVTDGLEFFLKTEEEGNNFKKRLIVCREGAYIASLTLFEE